MRNNALVTQDPHRSAGTTGNNLPKLLSALELLTEEELLQLNHVIVQRLRLMQQIRAHGQMATLRIGQQVTFTDSTGRQIRGVLALHNRKSVTVVTPDGHQWRVSPEFVRPA
jgi:hypothetical protein